MFLNFQNKFQKNLPKENKDIVNSLKILLIKVLRTNRHGCHGEFSQPRSLCSTSTNIHAKPCTL